MRNSRRLATIGVSIVATGALLGGTAAAQTSAAADAYGGTASSDALTISLFGQTITTSAATAELKPLLAKATATEVLTPLQQGTVSAELTTHGEKTEKPEACSGSQLTAIPAINRFDITCGEARVRLAADGGSARGLGAEVVLEPSVANLLEALQLQEPVQGGANQLIEALNPLFEGLTGSPLGPVVEGATTTVQDLLNDVLTLQSTVRIVIAPALAEVNANATNVVSHARAQGVRIELLPVDGAGATNNLLPDDLEAGEPLITITIGEAVATKTVTRDGSAEAKADALGALVKVEFGTTALTTALGLPDSTIEVAGGRRFCIPGLEGTPLETCISVANAGVDANGNPFAEGVSIQLLKGINGGIDLTTGRAASAGAATPVQAAEAPAGELPRTGGPATLPLVGGALLALAAAGRRLVSGRR